ncbi:MAG: hypothetical protein ACFFBS_10055 [Promethearchaeota archaeon]
MSEDFICPHCRHTGPLEINTKGKTSVEVILWLFFLVPGLVYSIWRRTGRYYGCPECGNPGMVPIGSHLGKHLLAEGQRSPAELAGTEI